MNKNGIEYCKICKDLPNAHSFELFCSGIDILEKDEDKKKVSVFYTRVANAIKYDDTKGIIEHYNNLLKLENPKKWRAVLQLNDSTGEIIKEFKSLKETGEFGFSPSAVRNCCHKNQAGEKVFKSAGYRWIYKD